VADAQQPDDPCQMCDGTRLMESGEPCFECQPEPVKPGNMPPWYAIMRLTTGGWAPHFKSQDPELGMVVHVDVAEKDDAVRLCWEHRNRIRAEARAEGARDQMGYQGFIIDLANQACLEWAAGAGGDSPCDQTSAPATEWCPHCRARMLLRIRTTERVVSMTRCPVGDAQQPDRNMDCAMGCGVAPHRYRPSPEAGPHWRCSECGEVTPAAPTQQSSEDRIRPTETSNTDD